MTVGRLARIRGVFYTLLVRFLDMGRMFRTALLTSLALTVSSALPAAAQSLEIAPLSLDVGEGDNLVVAALADAGTVPVVAGLSAANIIPAAAVVAAGRPQPSLILGSISAGQEAAFGIETLLSSTVAEVAFALDDLDAREALRARDPDLFRQLVEEGHVDPPAAQLNAQLQTELSRMNCYRSGIDGLWGPGSRRSVGEYFDQLENVSRTDQEPSNDLFRVILINGDVDCPTPVAATPQPSAPAAARPAPQQRTTAPATATAPAPTPPAQTETPRLTIGGSGVFR